MSLLDSLNDFRSGVALVDQYVSNAYALDANGNDLFDDLGKDFIVSSAFLKLFIAWEAFIEDVFAKYLVGELSTDGTAVAKHVTPVDRNHALKILIGTQKYVDWANHEIVKRLANLYLANGEPLNTNLNFISAELSDLKTIRNAAAHLSSTTKPQLDALASRILGNTTSGITVADFITRLHPSDNSKTVLQYYQAILDIAAENIAANRV